VISRKTRYPSRDKNPAKKTSSVSKASIETKRPFPTFSGVFHSRRRFFRVPNRKSGILIYLSHVFAGILISKPAAKYKKIPSRSRFGIRVLVVESRGIECRSEEDPIAASTV